MIYITQRIYIKEGQEDIFHQFEEIAISILASYKGRLMLRIRPDDNSVIELTAEKPYEVHIVQFPSDKNFEDFLHDEKRQQFLHMKEASIKSVVLIKGEMI